MRALEILLVDDDPVARKVTGAMLKRAQLAVHYAGSGAEALEFLENYPVALVLMDCSMPELDGFETTYRILKRLGAMAPPVVGLSAGMVGDDARGRAAGMRQFLRKPVSAKLLEECILLTLRSHDVREADDVHEVEVESTLHQAEHAVFDSVRAAAVVGGDEQLLRELIVVFISVSPTYLENISHAISFEQFKEIAQSAHMMKSAARSIAATELSALVDSLETAAEEARAKNLADQLAQIRSAYSRLILELQQFLDRTNRAPHAASAGVLP